ncbi:MAG: transcription antitermination factor NusB [Roseimicrobium sp.]
MAKPPSKRREGRQAAMQYLFAHDLHGVVSDAERNAFWEIHMAKGEVRTHAEWLVKGILDHQVDVDHRISSVLQNFSFERLGVVDRNILRLAVFEMLHTDVPRPVVINEAIEIAKDFGDTQTRAFVNGVLDRIAKSLPSKN